MCADYLTYWLGFSSSVLGNNCVKKNGRNPKCDRDWSKGNKSPKRKGKIKVQREKGK